MVAGIGFILILDVVVRQKFSGTKWSLPSHVYSRALELYEGLSLSQSQLVWELDQLGYRSVQNPASPGQYRASGREVVIKTRPFQFWDGAEPSRHLRLRFSGEQLRSVRADNGKHAALVRLEPMRIGGIYPDHREDREPVTLEKVPPYLVESLIAVEDRQFYRHHGVSLRGIGRALLGNVRSGAVTQGGSTLTQQLVKNF
ncbi:MAG TPA: penicillin-binding protein 1B, partial [Porticoccaceae bacterium]|nr:penicillin-binding protein 1B [Porticoccaceae bacterium]